MLKAFFYRFTNPGTPLPGPAYYNPLKKFQTYPQNMVQGGGTLVEKPFINQTPQYGNEFLAPIVSDWSGGGAGPNGQIIAQALINTQAAQGK